MDIQPVIIEILGFLEGIGYFGLFLAIFLEGASVPFPGIVAVLAYGAILNLSLVGMVGIAAAMAVVYTLASLIPYFIGNKLEHLLWKKLRKGLDRASRSFNRYGIWSIALSRPFGIGNYISYLAGIGNVGIRKYLLLTFVGIFPWCLGIMYLGDYLNGNYERFLLLFDEYKLEFYGTGIVLAILFIFYSLRQRRKKENK